MNDAKAAIHVKRLQGGRIDAVYECIARGVAPDFRDADGVSLLQWCAYYGDVSAIRFLLDKGEALTTLGPNFDLNGAAFHGHWQLAQFVIENGADVNRPLDDTGESPLHVALCGPDPMAADHLVKLLLAHGAKPDCVTFPGVRTGCLMRDARTRAETPLHRAAAFGTESSIRMLLDAGASRDRKDMNGDTPLSWASWHRRPDTILRLLLYDDFTIDRHRRPMRESLLGEPDM
jgi:ankyrin repeat protein